MGASTNLVVIKRDDERVQRQGTLRAQETTHPETGEAGVAIQYAHVQTDEYYGGDDPTEFVEGELVGVYDELSRGNLGETAEFKRLTSE